MLSISPYRYPNAVNLSERFLKIAFTISILSFIICSVASAIFLSYDPPKYKVVNFGLIVLGWTFGSLVPVATGGITYLALRSLRVLPTDGYLNECIYERTPTGFAIAQN